MNVETVRIVPEDPAQGNYIIINAEDFDKKKHKVYEGPDNPEPVAVEAPKTFEELQAELAEVKAKLAALDAPAGEGEAGKGAWGAPPAS